MSRPLSALAAAADEVARGKNAPHLDVRGPADIRRAAEAFNAMSNRVTRTLESQRQLLSAVGHDLRTPIAAMRITAEFVEDAEVRARLARNLDELQSLTEAVLSAARSGPGEEMRRVDLAALIQSLCDDLIDLGQPVEVSVRRSGAVPVPAQRNPPRGAQPDRERRALWRRRAGDAGPATVDTLRWLSRTTAPASPPDRLEHVFEPFVRLEESRCSDTGGAGLGLTLARSIAREHGGDVTLENRTPHGLSATLRLPKEKSLGCRRLQHAALDLVEFDALEQRAEIALAEAFVALPLDDLEEDRADGVLGEDLQQQALLRRAVNQDAVGAQALDVLVCASARACQCPRNTCRVCPGTATPFSRSPSTDCRCRR